MLNFIGKKRPTSVLSPSLLSPAFVIGVMALSTGCLAVNTMRTATSQGQVGHQQQPNQFLTRSSVPSDGGAALYASAGPAAGWAPMTPVTPQYFRQINDNTWRTRFPANTLYPLILRHLSGSYIIQSSDPRALSIQTDWDKFFLGGRLFRNRLSVNLFQVSQQDSEIVINNKVEYFLAKEEGLGSGEADWIPTQDVTNEKAQLIDSLGRIALSMHRSAAR